MNTHHTEAYSRVGLCSLPQPLFAEGSATAHLTHPRGLVYPSVLHKKLVGNCQGLFFIPFSRQVAKGKLS